MNVFIPLPGSYTFDDYVKGLAKNTGVDQMSIRLLLVTMVQQTETRDRLRRESDAREARGDIDI